MNAIHAFLAAALEVIDLVLTLYIWVLIIGAVLSWLVGFGIVNTYNRFVQKVMDICARLTEPALRPIRRVLPVIGGLDLSPLALIFIIMFLQSFIRHLVF